MPSPPGHLAMDLVEAILVLVQFPGIDRVDSVLIAGCVNRHHFSEAAIRASRLARPGSEIDVPPVATSRRADMSSQPPACAPGNLTGALENA